jgi:serine/threonine protein kinase
LHGVGIFHQDLKPSNVLVFPAIGSKIADLGRSCLTEILAPHDSVEFAGDFTYAPPEVLYGYMDPDVSRRRAAFDMYLLGSLVVFFFLRVGTTAAILTNIEPALANWRTFRDTFDDAMPFIRDAFDIVLKGFLIEVPEKARDDMRRMVQELCEPDPRLRGDPSERGRSQYSLERYISRLDLLARRAELRILG